MTDKTKEIALMVLGLEIRRMTDALRRAVAMKEHRDKLSVVVKALSEGKELDKEQEGLVVGVASNCPYGVVKPLMDELGSAS